MTEGSDQLFIGEAALLEFNGWLGSKADQFSSVFLLVDSNTLEHCLPKLASELSNLESFEILEMPPGEINKAWEIAGQLLLALSELGADRNSLLISLGGGVVTDMGGFIASVYKRGITSVLVPSSLLAMTDAAIGGKTAVDLDSVKNLVGTFSAPSATVIWPDLLSTLPEEVYADGMAETFKHALLEDESLLNDLLNNHELLSDEQIVRSARIKLNVVDSDPTEKGRRKILNLGHTVGHALESYTLTTENPWPHGRCVAAGILVALELSRSFYEFDVSRQQQITNALRNKYHLDELKSINFQSFEPWLMHDKKNVNGELRFVLLEAVGKPVYDIPVSYAEVESAWMRVYGHD